MKKFNVAKYTAKILILVFTLTISGQSENSAAYAKFSCNYVAKQAKSVFAKNWTEAQSKEPLGELAKRVNKSMTIVFSNQRCFKKTEVAEMRKSIRDIQKQCIDAKKDEFTWSFMKDLCEAFSGVYKYAK